MKDCVIVVPVYKETPSSDECASFCQCIRVLQAYDIVLVCPEGMGTCRYDRLAGRSIGKKFFPKEFFRGVEGYSRMLLGWNFYASFSSYRYMLIYQLDAWVFEDRLKYWCEKGYDYIGAPWFYRHRSHEAESPLWLVGNGGLSLRRIDRFMAITSSDSRVHFSLLHAFSRDFRRFGDRKRYVRQVRRFDGMTFKCYAGLFDNSWEDMVFCYGLRGTNLQLNVPEPEEAALFSIEVSPAYLYNSVNGGVLPFGCHAWRKYQYDEFWKKYITIQDEQNRNICAGT